MTRIFNPCHCYQEQISLLVSEALPDADRANLEQHLSACPGCRRYRDEIRIMTGSLFCWEENFASLQPSEAAVARWGEDFAAIRKPNRSTSSRMFDWCKDIIWPPRWIWAGLSAVWAVILALNFSQPYQVRTSVASPSPELVRAFLDGGVFLDQSQPIHPVERNMNSPTPPAPRSERRSGPVSNPTI